MRKTVASSLDRKDAVPGFVGAIQTFGAFGPSFYPHVHAIVTEGAWSRGGELLPCEAPDRSVIEEVFRREVLARLHRAERQSDALMKSLLSWTHSGFSVYAQQAIKLADSSKLARLARDATRSPIRLDAVERTPDGNVKIATPPDPRTGTSEIVLDPHDGVRAITSQIPDASIGCGTTGRTPAGPAVRVRGMRRAGRRARARPTSTTTPARRRPGGTTRAGLGSCASSWRSTHSCAVDAGRRCR
ncbi:MAG: transposase [Planctomycetes bacterium]|nr:transposase [Planctomycetota bacterium]MBI3843907.1 transposase [Planctomycetota bacterium]